MWINNLDLSIESIWPMVLAMVNKQDYIKKDEHNHPLDFARLDHLWEGCRYHCGHHFGIHDPLGCNLRFDPKTTRIVYNRGLVFTDEKW